MAQIYCKVEGIPGESSDDKHKDYFDVLSFSHGVAMEVDSSSTGTGGHSLGKSHHEPFTVTKLLDKSSPKLTFACAKGDHIPTVVVELWRHIGENSKYMEYKLSDAIVQSVTPGANGDERATETITFRYSRIDWTYTEFDNKGKKKGEVKQFHDLEKNKWG